MKPSTKKLGFSLVEVMIAVLVLGVGILAVAKLQSTLIKGGSDANQRTVATSLAQEKIDDLKSFTHLTTSASWTSGMAANEVVYSHISGDSDLTTYTETGGLIAPSATITVGQTVYSLNWIVDDYWHDAALTAPTITEPSPAPSTSDFKTITVTVGWIDATNEAQSVSLDTAIYAYAPALTVLSDNSQSGGTPPSASYTPGVAPDTVYVDVGGNKRESTDPNITVSQNQQYVEHEFSVITYDSNNNIVKQEDLKSVNCTCEKQSTNSVTYLPVGIELADNDTNFINQFDPDSSDFKVASGGKNWGVPLNTGQAGQQSDHCDICCRDHHDTTGPNNPDTLFDPFRPSSDYTSGDHNHYFPDNSGDLQLANDNGDTYIEACTLIKVNGIFRVAQDLNILTIKTMPESYLLGTGFTKYKNYKENYLLAYAKELDKESSFPAQTLGHVTSSSSIKYLLNDSASISVVTLVDEPDLDNPALSIGDTDNLRAKTLYARYIPSNLFSILKGTIEADTTWADISNLLPFYDPDGTVIAQTNDDTSAWGTDEPSQVSVNQSGQLTALDATNPTAIATATRSDSTTSFTNTRPIDPNDEDQDYQTSDEMLIAVSGSSSSTPINVKVTVTSAGSAVDPKSVTIVGSNGASCGLESNSVKYVHICSFSSGSGKLTVSTYTASSGNGNSATAVNSEVCPASGEPSITVADDGSFDETSTIIYTGLSDPTPDKTIHIVLESDGC